MILRRIEQLQSEHRELERQLERARRQGSSDVVGRLVEGAKAVDGARVVAEQVEVADQDELRALGDQLRERLQSGVVVLAAKSAERTALFAVVTDDLIGRGVRADRVVRTPYVVVIRGGGLAPAPAPWEYSLPQPKPSSSKP